MVGVTLFLVSHKATLWLGSYFYRGKSMQKNPDQPLGATEEKMTLVSFRIGNYFRILIFNK